MFRTDLQEFLKPSIRKSWLENGPNSHNHLRGVDPFVEVTWSEAEKIVANELKKGIEYFWKFSNFCWFLWVV